MAWVEGWLVFGYYLIVVTVLTLWMKKRRPELLQERLARKKDVKAWDRAILICYVFLYIGMLVVAGLDAKRFGWSHVSLVPKVLGFTGLISGSSLAFWALAENAFASNVVRIQAERGHQVCTTGPYRYVRHPMYADVIVLSFCIPLALGSLCALVAGFLLAVVFVIRTALEDVTLQRELAGYREYAVRVRYRLVPGLW
ncbi:MAG: isoprenylcysteine carboxylmethyltransferase family protein [Planctomycetota bacterium]